MAENATGDVTPKNEQVVEVTPEQFQQLQAKLEATQKEFTDFREKHKTVIDEIKDNSKGRFFKEGASKVENELREFFKIEDKLTGKELYEHLGSKFNTKVETKEDPKIAEATAAKLKTLEEALLAKTSEFETFKAEQVKAESVSRLKGFANTVLNSGKYQLSEDVNVNAKRLSSAISLTQDLKVDYSGVEPVLLGEDGLPIYNTDGTKVTLSSKIDEALGVFFDKKPTQDPKLQLLAGQGKKVEISKTIEDIDRQLRDRSLSSEKYLELVALKEQKVKESFKTK